MIPIAYTRTFLLLHRSRIVAWSNNRTQFLLDCHHVDRRLRAPWFVTRIHGERGGRAQERRLNIDNFATAPPYTHPDGLEPW